MTSWLPEPTKAKYQPPQPNNSILEDLMKAFINKSDEKFETQGTTIREQGTTIRNLERQMGQLVSLLSERAPGTFPADTKKNPKETIKAVSLRSGKTLEEPIAKPRQEKLDKCFGKFLEMLKQLYVNIPFTEVLTQMPAYAKFLKEILSSRRKLEETKVVKLNAHCSAILQNKIPQKCGDPGSFPIPYSLGSKNFDKALCDSGASINLMPLSVFKKLEGELGVIKSVSVSLQLAYQTTIIPEGIIEDILVRVDKFVFPVDFIVVDMEVNKEVPLILGIPFLYTSRAILDIYEGQLMLRVENKKMVFQMKRMMKYLCDEAFAYACLKLDMVGELAEQYKLDKLVGDSLERCISQSSTTDDEDPEIKKEVEALEDENQVVDKEEFEKEKIKPKLQLKVLLTYLKYAFLETNDFSVIIAANLTGEQEHMLVELLRKHKKAIGCVTPPISPRSPITRLS
ncbi:uncharacterized protein LOC107818924 [Nicotiana tabacum]|uniref:Uncharacterized protein LOC107818924 n=1 Tax=Nicotiana tabacum TaxID=4097 RepID=A0A1S4CH35_TOBAC|nr:PREDICTED: uncharacterized protein LOC107818924 [Nicotiana tabacum]